jgi:hypothetical protein
MAEPIDVYSDQFMVTNTMWGANLSFFLNTPHPEPTKVVPPERIATIRMSNEHLKIMTTILIRQIKKMEAESGIKIEIDSRYLNSIGVAREDWEKLWS